MNDRTRGPRVDLATAVRWMTSDTADLYGLRDRGRIAPGFRADLNVIDHDTLQLGQPEVVFDLLTACGLHLSLMSDWLTSLAAV